MSPSLHLETLLADCNPVLVIFPQDPEHYLRPGASRLPGLGQHWGDYNPCNAEFFLDRVVKRPQPKGFNPLEVIAALVPWARDRSTPTGTASIKREIEALVAAGSIDVTQQWELDLAGIPSQNERTAWTVYRRSLQDTTRIAYQPVAYGRVFHHDGYAALQYWYLYAYNDFFNNHEADWEMVNIELSPSGTPTCIGLSCHQGGNAMRWEDAPKNREGRPIIRVGRGSHAGYFSYKASGYDPINVLRRVHPPPPFRFLKPILRNLPHIPWKKDFAPALRAVDANAPEEHYGQELHPMLVHLPETPPAIGSLEWDAFWWRHFQGMWGSRHTRLIGTIGVDSPWAGGHPERWADPNRWMDFIGRPQAAT